LSPRSCELQPIDRQGKNNSPRGLGRCIETRSCRAANLDLE
jgi:hypothetical protein